MISPSNQAWMQAEEARAKLWPSLLAEALVEPWQDDGRGVICLDEEIQASPGIGFKVVHWSKMAMLDWDVSDVPKCNTMAPEEVPVLMNRLAILHKQRGCGIRLYVTPGGFRGFITSFTPSTEVWLRICQYLHVDLLYMQIHMKRKDGLQPGWACRTSPKPGREGDFVARLVGQWGPVISELAPYVLMHDNLVQRFHS